MKRLWKIGGSILEHFATILYIAFFVLILLQVFVRYVLNTPFSWTEEASRYLNMWCVFIAAALAVSKIGHLRVDLIDKYVKGKSKRKLNIVLGIISIFSISMLLIGSVKMTIESWSVSMTMIPLPQGLLYLACAISSALMIIFFIRAIFKPSEEEQN